jgi:L-rhamnose mutarotase
MERFCYAFQIAPGMEAEYERRHKEIWPGLVEAIKNAGFSNYSLFRRGREVIAYAECDPSSQSALERLELEEVSHHWNRHIRSIMTSVVDSDGHLFTYDEIWYLD